MKKILVIFFSGILLLLSGCSPKTSITTDTQVSAESNKVSIDVTSEESEDFLTSEQTVDTMEQLEITEDNEEKYYKLEDYGKLEIVRQEFTDEENGKLAYYYELEKFYVGDNVTNASSVNAVLDSFYDKCEKRYLEESKSDNECRDQFVPYNNLHFLNIKYVGDDYISIQYNDVAYYGGAHPYSCFDGITIDLKSGEEVFASPFLEKSDEEILGEISNAMGFDGMIGTWDDIDFYITDSKIVFFYRMFIYRDDVVLDRK